MTRRLRRYGAEHCDTQTVVFIDLGWPPGTATSEPTRRRQYVRDPHESLPADAVPRTLDLDTRLPTTARFSGFRTEKMQLWLSPEDQDRAAYVAVGKTVERWPRATKSLGCA